MSQVYGNSHQWLANLANNNNNNNFVPQVASPYEFTPQAPTGMFDTRLTTGNVGGVGSNLNMPALNNTNNQGGGAFTNKAMFGDKGGMGWLNGGAQVASALGQGWLGYQGLKLGKSQLAQGKKEFTDNFNARAKTINTANNDSYVATYARATPESQANMLSPEEKAKRDNIQSV